MQPLDRVGLADPEVLQHLDMLCRKAKDRANAAGQRAYEAHRRVEINRAHSVVSGAYVFPGGLHGDDRAAAAAAQEFLVAFFAWRLAQDERKAFERDL